MKGRSQSSDLSRQNRTDSQSSTGPSMGAMMPSCTKNSSSLSTGAASTEMRNLSTRAATTKQNSNTQTHAREASMRVLKMKEPQALKAALKAKAARCMTCNAVLKKSEANSCCPEGPRELGFRPGEPCCHSCSNHLLKRHQWFQEDQQKRYPHLARQHNQPASSSSG